MIRLLAILLSLVVSLSAADARAANRVTFNKDVLSILQKRCQECHRPGEVAPMSLLTYQDARPWAKAIKEAVAIKKMPPWFADPKYGHFVNDRRLADDEVAKLVAWADAGAPEGLAKDKPAPVKFTEGWNIKPDVVISLPEALDVQATGTIEYTYVVVPTGFTKDTWVTAAEVRPGNRAVVHHVIASVRPPGSNYLKAAKPGIPFIPTAGRKRDENGAIIPQERPAAATQRSNNDSNNNAPSQEFLVGYAPGLQQQDYSLGVRGAAKLIPAGSDIVFQMHYTANGQAAKDQTKVGLTLATEEPKYRYLTLAAAAPKLEIPANDSNYESHAAATINEPGELVWLMPHMHLRGKDMIFKAVYPTGESETLLSVPKFDFNWQLGYDEVKPLVIPKGTRFEITAHHDNSANNPANPNSNIMVRWGDQSWEEMMIGWFALVVKADVKPSSVIAREARRGGE